MATFRLFFGNPSLLQVDNEVAAASDTTDVSLVQAGTTSDTPRVVILTSGTSWVVPPDFNPLDNEIHLIGKGQGGFASFKGGNGASGDGSYWAALVNRPYAPGQTINYSLSTIYTLQSWFDGTSDADAQLVASVAGAVGDLTNPGGLHQSGSSGPTPNIGGAAGGPHGAGEDGGTGARANNGFPNEWKQSSDGILATPGGGGAGLSASGPDGMDYGGGGAGGTTSGGLAGNGGASVLVIVWRQATRDITDATQIAGTIILEALNAGDLQLGSNVNENTDAESAPATAITSASVTFATSQVEAAAATDFIIGTVAYINSIIEGTSATSATDATSIRVAAVTEAASAIDTNISFANTEDLIQEDGSASDTSDIDSVFTTSSCIESASASDQSDATWSTNSVINEAASAQDSSDGCYVFPDFFGSQLLYHNATGLEKSLADVEAWALFQINAELIIENWDPYLVQTQNIPYLAFGLGVTLWEDDYWAEGTQRQWMADQWTYKSIRGTIGGIRMALDISKYNLIHYVTPPQGFYISPDLSPEKMNAWIRRMPELRFTYAPKVGQAGIDDCFVDDGFFDADFISINDGFALRGRYAFIRRFGVETPLDIIEYHPALADVNTVEYERVSEPGISNLGFFVEESAIDDDEFLDQEDVSPNLYTIRIDGQSQIDVSFSTLSTITPGLEPFTPSFEVNSDIGDAGLFAYLDGDFVDDCFLESSDRDGLLLAQRMYLLDPAVAVPMNIGLSFLDADRLGLQTFTEELMIDLHMIEKGPAFFSDEAFLDSDFLIPEDTTHIDRAFRAVNDAKALRDTALVTFETKRLVALGDKLTETTLATDWVAETL